MGADTDRELVRIRRRNRAAINPTGLGELLYRQLLEYDPECREALVELDAEGVGRLQSQAGYEVRRVEEGD
jgi:hypothetical protein